MPVTPAPIFARNSHSSTTCGSVAAWRISVTPRRWRRGQQRRLGAGDRRLVEIHRRALEAVRRLEHVVRAARPAARPSPRSASRCVEIVRRAGKVAAGRRDVRASRSARAAARAAAPSRAAGRPARGRARACGRVGVRMRSVVRADAVDLGAEVEQQPRHHLDVADARHVGQHALLVGQQARGQQRQRRVLVAFDGDAALEPVAAFDQQCRHSAVRFRSDTARPGRCAEARANTGSGRSRMPNAIERPARLIRAAKAQHVARRRAAAIDDRQRVLRREPDGARRRRPWRSRRARSATPPESSQSPSGMRETPAAPASASTRSARTRPATTGFMKNEPTLRVSGSAASITMPLRRRIASTAARTSATVGCGDAVPRRSGRRTSG